MSLSGYFRTVCGDTLDGARDTKTAVLREVSRRLGGVADAVMVGDRVHDIVGARDLGWVPAAATWGYGSAMEFDDAELLVRDPAQLPHLIARSATV